jgi:hypothetical protein
VKAKGYRVKSPNHRSTSNSLRLKNLLKGIEPQDFAPALSAKFMINRPGEGVPLNPPISQNELIFSFPLQRFPLTLRRPLRKQVLNQGAC